MDTNRTSILEESDKILERLQKLVLYFENQTIMNIYLQNRVIHKLFEDNPDIDVNKLELYHIQFSSTLIELLEKIKKKNERFVGMMENEIQLNNNVIEKLRQSLYQEGSFDFEKGRQAKRITRSIYNLHKALASQSNEYPYVDNISSFSIDFYKDHFYDVDKALLPELISYESTDVYRNKYGTVGKEILTALTQNRYLLDFVAGIKVGNMLIEIYNIRDQQLHFIFVSAKNLFLPVDISLFPLMSEWIEQSLKKKNLIRELTQKNIDLDKSIRQNKKKIDDDILLLLKDNHQKITEVDFLADLENIDIQANTLRAMLETKMI